MLKIEGKHRGKKIGVLLGGPSGEREVSLRSGQAVHQALLERGYVAVAIDAGQDVIEVIRREKVEIAYNALHGTWGEDGLVQALLENARIPYTGSGVEASVLTMDKIVTKRLAESEDVPTPGYQVVERGREFHPSSLSLPLPIVVKPSREGSSLGVTICKDISEVPAAMAAAFALDKSVLIERFIAGRELTVSVVQGRALPLVEIVSSREFYDYTAKYTAGMSQYFCPADVQKEVAAKMQRLSETCYQIFHCRGAVRVDFRLSPHNEPFMIELNTSPGMTQLSLLPMAAKAAGFGFADLVELVLDQAGLEENLRW